MRRTAGGAVLGNIYESGYSDPNMEDERTFATWTPSHMTDEQLAAYDVQVADDIFKEKLQPALSRTATGPYDGQVSCAGGWPGSGFTDTVCVWRRPGAGTVSFYQFQGQGPDASLTGLQQVAKELAIPR